jgi:hypothetical protein
VYGSLFHCYFESGWMSSLLYLCEVVTFSPSMRSGRRLVVHREGLVRVSVSLCVCCVGCVIMTQHCMPSSIS